MTLLASFGKSTIHKRMLLLPVVKIQLNVDDWTAYPKILAHLIEHEIESNMQADYRFKNRNTYWASGKKDTEFSDCNFRNIQNKHNTCIQKCIRIGIPRYTLRLKQTEKSGPRLFNSINISSTTKTKKKNVTENGHIVRFQLIVTDFYAI